MLFTLSLDFQSFLLAVSLNSNADRFVQNAIQNCTHATGNSNSICLCKFLNGLTQRVIVGNHFDQIEPLLESLNSMDFGSSINRKRKQRLLFSLQERRRDILQQRRNVDG